MSNLPDFRSRAVLLAHAQHSMSFYHPRCIDWSGGMYHFFKDDGSVYDSEQRHLVSSTRFVFTYAMAYRHFGQPEYLDGLRHALSFLREAHRDTEFGGYSWLLRCHPGGREVADGTQHAYGQAFVLLAYSHALMAGLEEARPWVAETFELMERSFWEPEAGLYADEASRDWSERSSYRGQNANMHACEALLAAYRATGETRYLERAYTVAFNITQRQAERCGGLIWEHYDANWQPDWQFNIKDPANLFRPWGYQPGHFTEWAKLLLQLESLGGVLECDLSWALPTAERLFKVAVEKGWHAEHGGLCYSISPETEHLRRGQVLLGPGRKRGSRRHAGPAHESSLLLGLVRAPLGLQLDAFCRPRAWRLVAHPRCAEPQVQRREEPGWQGGLSHHGRLLRHRGGTGRRIG